MAEVSFRRLSLVVPCLNEADNIRRYDDELIGVFQKYPFESEFVFIDDGSTDATLEMLQALAKKYSNVIVEKHQSRQGLGAALKTGFARATGDALLTLDADLTFHPSEFPRLLDVFSADVSCVTGSAARGRFQGVSLSRRFLSVGVNRLYSWLLGVDITSASSIFRLYRRAALSAISIKSRDFDINAEIVSKLVLSGRRVIEAPVALTSRIYGESKINYVREMKNHLMMFIKILFWKLSVKRT